MFLPIAFVRGEPEQALGAAVPRRDRAVEPMPTIASSLDSTIADSCARRERAALSSDEMSVSVSTTPANALGDRASASPLVAAIRQDAQKSTACRRCRDLDLEHRALAQRALDVLHQAGALDVVREVADLAAEVVLDEWNTDAIRGVNRRIRSSRSRNSVPTSVPSSRCCMSALSSLSSRSSAGTRR
jgi:hypothetical protein